MKHTIYTTKNLGRLLDFCIYEIYEKQDKDFNGERYLKFISDILKNME